MYPKDLLVSAFNYELPADRIAAFPLEERDQSKLLIAAKGADLEEDIYRNLAEHLPGGSLLLFNDTRVVEARLRFRKESGGGIEIFCLEPHEQYATMATALASTGSVLWLCMVGGASKWKSGVKLERRIIVDRQEIVLHATWVEKRPNSMLIELTWTPAGLSFAELLHHAGAIPLPPYIKRLPEASDLERYQTIYAKHEGSVAAPTAGLHFTEAVFDSLRHKGIEKTYLTLHVGAGTFKPVTAEKIGEHEMHAEVITITKEFLHTIRSSIGNIIPVGTTSMRTIESLYWFGVKLSDFRGEEDFDWWLDQWEAYELPQEMGAIDAIETLLNWMERNDQSTIIARTRIIIAPGYRMRMAKALITNFHQPQSTLLLLIAAIMGDQWKRMYEYALEHEFRFLSYGDGCLIWV